MGDPKKKKWKNPLDFYCDQSLLKKCPAFWRQKMRLMVKSRSISVWRKVGNRKRFSTYLLWRKKYILIAKKMMADPASFNKMILLILLIKGKEKLRSYILANISYRKKNLSDSMQNRRRVWKSGWGISNTKSFDWI